VVLSPLNPPPPVHDLPVKQTKRTKRKRKKKNERKRTTQQDRYFESLDKYARETIRERKRERESFKDSSFMFIVYYYLGGVVYRELAWK
jgi:hypothetical protein